MLEQLQQQPPDKILALMQTFKEDPRANKLDLGIGVYKNENGQTPIINAVKKAEKILWEQETTKSYTKLTGDSDFQTVMKELIFSDCVSEDIISTAHTPGGTGAIRQAFELIRLASPNSKIWISNPTWPNHISILKFLNIPYSEYVYFDKKTCELNFDGMMESLKNTKPGDIILLHGCCHNPTGANLNNDQWKELQKFLCDNQLVPLIDLAYQGFGDGLDEDAYGVRLLAKKCKEVILAASCSKNFGIYRERTGILFTISENEKIKNISSNTLAFLNRQNFSFPPDHGGKLVTLILKNEELKSSWIKELNEMRLNMLDIRKSLAEELRKKSQSNRFDFLETHRGMFSLLGATKDQVLSMREKHAIYMIEDSRVNIAGLNKKRLSKLAGAIIDVGI
ncbi:MAG: aromatic amino acid transaminase [Paracoccaceae bacterium]|nr:aspartate/tyrosine/aromatic aminotransferase [Paracoccaceae bacterium]|tara:strand:- start:3513 stop:4697 length:1185 start_codon:yes stop_codon:yes gene_type:complete